VSSQGFEQEFNGDTIARLFLIADITEWVDVTDRVWKAIIYKQRDRAYKNRLWLFITDLHSFKALIPLPLFWD